MLIKPKLHPAYVSRDEFNEIQEILRLNAPSKERRNLGPGPALLQGIIRCHTHSTRVMSPAYYRPDRDGRCRYVYRCEGDYPAGGKVCMYPSGIQLDHAVTRAVLERLSVPRLEILRDVWQRARDEATRCEGSVECELRRARQAVDQARERCLAVNPRNRLVADEYEGALEAAKRRLQDLESAGASHKKSALAAFDDEAWSELLDLAKDVESILNAPTTTARDRKEIVRTIVATVFVESQERETIRARIVWVDRVPDTIVEAKTSA